MNTKIENTGLTNNNIIFTNYNMIVNLSQITPTRIIAALVTLLVLDSLWFSISLKRVYPQFNNVKIAWGLLAWIPLAIAIASANPDSTPSAIQWGAAVGFTTYAVFNGTEIAIRPDWTPTIGLIDLAWGTFASSIAAYTLYTLKI